MAAEARTPRRVVKAALTLLPVYVGATKRGRQCAQRNQPCILLFHRYIGTTPRRTHGLRGPEDSGTTGARRRGTNDTTDKPDARIIRPSRVRSVTPCKAERGKRVIFSPTTGPLAFSGCACRLAERERCARFEGWTTENRPPAGRRNSGEKRQALSSALRRRWEGAFFFTASVNCSHAFQAVRQD